MSEIERHIKGDCVECDFYAYKTLTGDARTPLGRAMSEASQQGYEFVAVIGGSAIMRRRAHYQRKNAADNRVNPPDRRDTSKEEGVVANNRRVCKVFCRRKDKGRRPMSDVSQGGGASA